MDTSKNQLAPSPKAACDVVVIGGGVSGLTAGAILAKGGLDVQIFEAHSKPGGYLATFEREGFHFDSAIHWLNLCGPGQVISRLLEFVTEDTLQFTVPNRIRRYKSSEFDYTLTSNPNLLREELKRDFPVDAAGIDAFFDAAYKVGCAFSSFSQRMRAPSTMGWFDKMRAGVTVAKESYPMWRYSSVQSEKGLNKFFSDPILKDMFASEKMLIACLMPIGWAYTNNYQQSPLGGSRVLVDSISHAASDLGAQLNCGTRVTKILTSDRGVSGVEYLKTDGNAGIVSCPRVIAANDLLSVFTELLDGGAISKACIKKQTDADLYSSAVTVSLGLNVPSESLGFDEAIISLTNSRQSRAEHSSGDPAKSCLSILARSVVDKKLAPPGKGTLTIFSQVDMSYRDQWLTGPKFERNQKYKDLKNEYAQVIIDRTAAALCPQLRDHIELIDIATPVTYWRYTGNHVGSMMGQRPTKKNIYSRLAGNITPIKGLYRAGHWAEYGGGVPSAIRSATNSALHILKEENSDLFQPLVNVFNG